MCPENLVFFPDLLSIALKQFNSLTISDTFSCLGGREVTHQIAVPKVPGSIKTSVVIFDFLCFSCVFTLFGTKLVI